jgi:hypothetical protein
MSVLDFFVISASVATLIGLFVFWPRPKQAKPKFQRFENCRISPSMGNSFEVLISNAEGSKNCSLEGAEDLIWPDGSTTPLKFDDKNPVPVAIRAGETVRIKIWLWGRLPSTLGQNNIQGKVILKFNTNKTIEEDITFIIG